MRQPIQAAIWAADHLDSPCKLVALALSSYADFNGVCSPTIPHICDVTNYAERTVMSALRRLERNNVLHIDHRPGKPNLYRFTAQYSGIR